jgi:hypothetical protein
MPRFSFLLALTAIFLMQTIPAFCGVSKTMSFQISVTIPPHVIANGALGLSLISNHLYQIVQTQTIIRNNRSISLTSIVVP